MKSFRFVAFFAIGFVCLLWAQSPLALAQAADADPLTPIRMAYRAGQFQTAQHLGELSGSAEGLTLAAAAAMAHARFELTGDPAMSALERAEGLARKAISLNPHDITARLILAVSLGAQSREMTLVSAYFSDIALIGRQEIDAVLATNPKEPRALALSGLWHLEVIRRAGNSLGGVVYNADQALGIAEFDAALAGAPDDPAIRVEFATALLALKDSHLVPRARQELIAALELPPRDAFERLTLEQGQRILDKLSQTSTVSP